jgi:hypothetical protein
MNGQGVTYAELDGVPICILNDGRWCERELGHDGPHVLADESSNSGSES